MTHKDYVKIAKVFASTMPPEGTLSRAQWAEMRHVMAQALAGDNPRFSRERFNAACEERE